MEKGKTQNLDLHEMMSLSQSTCGVDYINQRKKKKKSVNFTDFTSKN